MLPCSPSYPDHAVFDASDGRGDHLDHHNRSDRADCSLAGFVPSWRESRLGLAQLEAHSVPAVGSKSVSEIGQELGTGIAALSIRVDRLVRTEMVGQSDDTDNILRTLAHLTRNGQASGPLHADDQCEHPSVVYAVLALGHGYARKSYSPRNCLRSPALSRYNTFLCCRRSACPRV